MELFYLGTHLANTPDTRVEMNVLLPNRQSPQAARSVMLEVILEQPAAIERTPRNLSNAATRK